MVKFLRTGSKILHENLGGSFMKKFLAVFLAIVMVAGLFALTACSDKGNTDPSGTSGSADKPAASDYKIAMITDYGDITDQSFNQTTYEACKAFGEANNIPFEYFKPADNTDAAREAMIDNAIDKGYNVIVMPGYAFATAILKCAPNYPDVKFFALDVAKGDFLEAGVKLAGEEYDYNPDNWDFEKYVNLDNIYSAIYKEELSGYMAGYAAVKLGYTKLGFLGGMAVPAVVRFGYGYVQGADTAAKELDITIDMNYVYGGKFAGDPAITAVMDTWYQDGTEVVFACGGGIYTSAAEAAQKKGMKVIGVDTDQKPIIDGGYGDGITVTSAMKGLAPATKDTLAAIVAGKWDEYKGKITSLGLVSGDDPTLNYVQLPMDSTQFGEGFTKEDYTALVKKMFDGEITVSDDITAFPTVTNTNVSNQGSIIG